MRASIVTAFLAIVTISALNHFRPVETTVEAQRAELIYVLDNERATKAFRPTVRNSFASQNATGATAAIIPDNALKTHSIQLIVTGGPAGCTYRLQGSNDGGTTWFNVSQADITCTATVNAFEVDKPAARLRGNLLTLSGGTAPTVTLHYVGVM